MGSKVVYEAMAKGGTYTNAEGQEKVRWIRCGVVLQGDKGLSLKLESIPVAGFDGWISLFPPREKTHQQTGRASQSQKPATAGAPDDNPF